jgi:hypothetical protein
LLVKHLKINFLLLRFWEKVQRDLANPILRLLNSDSCLPA